jgi:hypothetical protein
MARELGMNPAKLASWTTTARSCGRCRSGSIGRSRGRCRSGSIDRGIPRLAVGLFEHLNARELKVLLSGIEIPGGHAAPSTMSANFGSPAALTKISAPAQRAELVDLRKPLLRHRGPSLVVAFGPGLRSSEPVAHLGPDRPQASRARCARGGERDRGRLSGFSRPSATSIPRWACGKLDRQRLIADGAIFSVSSS